MIAMFNKIQFKNNVDLVYVFYPVTSIKESTLSHLQY